MPSLTDAARTCLPDADRQIGEQVVAAWRVHRLRDNPSGIYLLAGVYAMAFILWRLVFPQPLALALPVFALTGALSDYLFPTHYRLTTRGAYADCGASRLFIAWTDVRRASTGSDGIFLSPFSRPSRLDSFRGIRLRVTSDDSERIREQARALWRGTRKAS